MDSIKLLNEFPGTKFAIGQFVQKAKEELLNGEYNPIPVMIQLKCIEEAISRIRKDSDILEHTNKKVALYSGRFDTENALVETAELGTKYDYSQCGDHDYEHLIEQQMELDKKIKERETFLKSLPKDGMDQVDIYTGEVYHIYRPSKKSTTGIKIILK